MYFKQIDEIIRGEKMQTRRVVKPDESCLFWHTPLRGGARLLCTFQQMAMSALSAPSGDDSIDRVCTAAGRLKWQVGRDYAVSPGRGKPGVWWCELLDGTRQWQQNRPGEMNNWRPLRIRILEIRREPLQAISEADVLAEGYPHEWPPRGPVMHPHQTSPHLWYRELWQSINARAPSRWEDNPDVWVLTFEVVRD